MIPQYVWTKRLDEAEPSRSVHTFSRPPVLEALGLLNVAARVGMYISGTYRTLSSLHFLFSYLTIPTHINLKANVPIEENLFLILMELL